MTHHCFKQGCKSEVQYICLCLPSETFCCEIHLKEHFKIPNRNHDFDSLISELHKWTKDGILKFLRKEKLKKNTLKKIALTCFTKEICIYNISIRKSLKGLDCDLKKINDLIIKTTQVSEQEEASLLNSLALPPDFDAKKVEKMLPNGSEREIKLFCGLGQLKNKKFAILNKENNDLKTEQDFRRTCALYEKNANHWLLRQAYKEYINAYQKITSLYSFEINNQKIKLFKYSTESEKEYVKILDNPNEISNFEYIIQIPNGELFILGKKFDDEKSAFIIDRNYRIRQLTFFGSCDFSKCIYFNRSVYCIGCHYISGGKKIVFLRFDLDENRWRSLAPIEIYISTNSKTSITIFNGSILIHEEDYDDLLLYSIDIDSFSTITYKKKHDKYMSDSIFINSEERLYLFERSGWIYESEVNNVYNWKKISFSKWNFNDYNVYCSYNKRGIYISLKPDYGCRRYLKFDLCKKELIEIAYYDDDLVLKKSNGKLKVIESNRKNLKLDSDEIKNEYTLDYIHRELSWLFSSHSQSYDFLTEKGNSYQKIGWNHEAIECYNKVIQLDAINDYAYRYKGNSLRELGKNIEALECYNKDIKLRPYDNEIIIFKGISLYNLGRSIEAIECYNKSIKRYSNNASGYFYKGIALNDLGRDAEALECINEAIRLNTTPSNFGIYVEFCHFDCVLYCAYLLYNLGQEKKAIMCFKDIYDYFIIDYHNYDSRLVYNCYKLLKIVLKLIKSTVEFKKGLKKMRNSRLKSLEILKETEKKELIIKNQSSELIKKAVECASLKNKHKSIEETIQIGIKVSEHQKIIAGMAIELSLFLYFQEWKGIIKP